MTRVTIQLDHSDESEGVVPEPKLEFRTLGEAIKFLIDTKVAESEPKGLWRDPVANKEDPIPDIDRYQEEKEEYQKEKEDERTEADDENEAVEENEKFSEVNK